MAWRKGQSGNPGGRPFGSEKEYTQALRIISKQEIDDPNNPGKRLTKLRRMGEIVWDKALAGENWAIQHIAERFEGKPAQMLESIEERRAQLQVVHEIVHVSESREEFETKNLLLTHQGPSNGNERGN